MSQGGNRTSSSDDASSPEEFSGESARHPSTSGSLSSSDQGKRDDLVAAVGARGAVGWRATRAWRVTGGAVLVCKGHCRAWNIHRCKKCGELSFSFTTALIRKITGPFLHSKRNCESQTKRGLLGIPFQEASCKIPAALPPPSAEFQQQLNFSPPSPPSPNSPSAFIYFWKSLPVACLDVGVSRRGDIFLGGRGNASPEAPPWSPLFSIPASIHAQYTPTPPLPVLQGHPCFCTEMIFTGPGLHTICGPARMRVGFNDANLKSRLTK
jgi:hypothetical protein